MADGAICGLADSLQVVASANDCEDGYDSADDTVATALHICRYGYPGRQLDRQTLRLVSMLSTREGLLGVAPDVVELLRMAKSLARNCLS